MSVKDIPCFSDDVRTELESARRNHPPINSIHEGYAIILEELDELWEQARKKTSERDLQNIYRECVQIAAMAQRTAEDILHIPVPPPPRRIREGSSEPEDMKFVPPSKKDLEKYLKRALAQGVNAQEDYEKGVFDGM
jgi:hypothetical protein